MRGEAAHARWQLNLDTAKAGLIYRIVVVHAPEFGRDLVEIVDGGKIREPYAQMRRQMSSQRPVGTTQQH